MQIQPLVVRPLPNHKRARKRYRKYLKYRNSPAHHPWCRTAASAPSRLATGGRQKGQKGQKPKEPAQNGRRMEPMVSANNRQKRPETSDGFATRRECGASIRADVED